MGGFSNTCYKIGDNFINERKQKYVLFIIGTLKVVVQIQISLGFQHRAVTMVYEQK